MVTCNVCLCGQEASTAEVMVDQETGTRENLIHGWSGRDGKRFWDLKNFDIFWRYLTCKQGGRSQHDGHCLNVAVSWVHFAISFCRMNLVSWQKTTLRILCFWSKAARDHWSLEKLRRHRTMAPPERLQSRYQLNSVDQCSSERFAECKTEKCSRMAQELGGSFSVAVSSCSFNGFLCCCWRCDWRRQVISRASSTCLMFEVFWSTYCSQINCIVLQKAQSDLFVQWSECITDVKTHDLMLPTRFSHDRCRRALHSVLGGRKAAHDFDPSWSILRVTWLATVVFKQLILWAG